MSHAAPGNPAISDPAQTRRVAASADRRANRARALSLAGRWLSGAAVVALALVLVWKFVALPWIRAIDWWWLVVTPLLVAAAPAVIALARPAQSRRGALTLDENLALKNRLTSAIDLHDRAPAGVDAGFAELAVRRAEELARAVRPDDAVPIRVDRAWAVWPALVVLAIGAGVFVRTRPPSLVVVAQVTKEEAKQAGEQVRAAARVIEAIKSEPTLAGPDVQRQLDAIAGVERELSAGRTLPADARTQSAKALERLARSLKDNAGRELSAQDALRDSLLSAGRAKDAIAPEAKSDDATEAESSELAKALRRGDLAAAQDAAQELMDRMSSMSADERAALAKELRELSGQMAKPDAANPGGPASNASSDGTLDSDGSAARNGQDGKSDDSRASDAAKTDEASTQAEPNNADRKSDPPATSDPASFETTTITDDKPEAAKPNAGKPDEATRDNTKPESSTPDARNPEPTSGQSTPPGEKKADGAKPDQSAKPTPPSGTPIEKPKPSSAEQRKEQLRRAMEDAARDLADSDKPRDANQREGESQRQPGQSSERSREGKQGESKQAEAQSSDNKQNESKSNEKKPVEGAPGDQSKREGEPKNSESPRKPPTPGDRANESQRSSTSEKKHEPRPEARDEKTSEPTGANPGTPKSDSQAGEADKPDASKPDANKSDANKPDATKPDAPKPGAKQTDAGKPSESPNGEKSPRPDSPGLRKLADTLRDAEEAQKNASRDSKLADRLRDQAMKTLENASPEQIDKAAEAARELAKRAPRSDPSSASPETTRRMLEQAEQLMKNATPEQRQKLQQLARKMAEGMPDNSNTGEDKSGSKSGQDQSQDAARRAAERFMKSASPEEKKQLQDLARSLGLDRPNPRGDGSGRGNGPGDRAGEGPGRDRGSAREFGDAEQKAVDMRDRSKGEAPAPNDRVISDWFDPSGKPGDRAASNRSSSGAEIVRRAAQGAERSIEQQVVPPQQGEYVRRVFRRYLQRTQGVAPTPGAPPTSPSTPDAPDAPRK